MAAEFALGLMVLMERLFLREIELTNFKTSSIFLDLWSVALGKWSKRIPLPAILQSGKPCFISFQIIYPRLPCQSKKTAFQGDVLKI